MATASIDNLAPTRSLIDLTQGGRGDFGLDDYQLSFVFDDILLVEYADESANGDEVLRNGIVVPTNAMTKAWRKGRVILAGPDTKYAKEGDIVIFPSFIVHRAPKVLLNIKKTIISFNLQFDFINPDVLPTINSL